MKKELENPNKIFIDAIKKGIILFGQEKFIKFIRRYQESEKEVRLLCARRKDEKKGKSIRDFLLENRTIRQKGYIQKQK